MATPSQRLYFLLSLSPKRLFHSTVFLHPSLSSLLSLGNFFNTLDQTGLTLLTPCPSTFYLHMKGYFQLCCEICSTSCHWTCSYSITFHVTLNYKIYLIWSPVSEHRPKTFLYRGTSVASCTLYFSCDAVVKDWEESGSGIQLVYLRQQDTHYG
jgi:hypothetical protein